MYLNIYVRIVTILTDFNNEFEYLKLNDIF